MIAKEDTGIYSPGLESSKLKGENFGAHVKKRFLFNARNSSSVFWGNTGHL